MTPSGSQWDEQWVCPNCGTGIAVGNGKHGGTAIVTFASPPHCFCGCEMEQRTDFSIQPGDCRPPEAA